MLKRTLHRFISPGRSRNTPTETRISTGLMGHKAKLLWEKVFMKQIELSAYIAVSRIFFSIFSPLVKTAPFFFLSEEFIFTSTFFIIKYYAIYNITFFLPSEDSVVDEVRSVSRVAITLSLKDFNVNLITRNGAQLKKVHSWSCLEGYKLAPRFELCHPASRL